MYVNTLTKKLPLSLTPFEAYNRLCVAGNKAHSALLETAEVGTHNHQKSVIMVSAAVKIYATNHHVILEALNENGTSFLQNFDNSDLKQFVIEQDEQQIQLTLKNSPPNIDEEKRLTESSVLDILKEIIKQTHSANIENNQSSCLIGAFSFDLVDQFEQLPAVDKQDEDYCFYLADQLLIQSIDSQSAIIVVKGFADNGNNTIRLGLNIDTIEKNLNNPVKHRVAKTIANNIALDLSDEVFAEKVNAIKQNIIDGDAFQVVLSRTYQVDCADALTSYDVLRQTNPSPYMYFINFGDKQLLGASPESALKVNRQKEVLLYPIAGTRKRAVSEAGIDYEKDSKTEFELIQDQKETAEHMMLVDLARNDLARIVQAGSRRVTQLKQLVRYSHVMHLVSEVRGLLKPAIDCLDAYRACANMGTLSGAPKIKAMQIIRQQEQKARGFYGGAVAIINANQEFDSAIIIRSAVVKDNKAFISAGAGIVYDSNEKNETQETYNKARVVIDACLQANKQLLVKQEAVI